MVMAAVSLLEENPDPTEDQVREGLEGNLCRCTGYHNIIRAVLAAASANGQAEVTASFQPNSTTWQPTRPLTRSTLLGQHGDDAKVLAGGHSLLPMMKLRLAAPAVLIDITSASGLSGISVDGDE